MGVLSSTEQAALIKLVPEFEDFIPELNQVFQRYIEARVEYEVTPSPKDLKKRTDDICTTIDAFVFFSEKLKLQVQALNGWVAPDIKLAELEHGMPLINDILTAQVHALDLAVAIKKSEEWIPRKDQVLKPVRDLIYGLIDIYKSATGNIPGRTNPTDSTIPGTKTEQSIIAKIIDVVADALELKSCKGLIRKSIDNLHLIEKNKDLFNG